MRMMRTISFPLTLGLTLLALPAFATTFEPNGTEIPRDSKNGEIQLYTLFANRGDPVDWLLDSGTKPDTFSPLCEFTATYVLNQAGNHFGLSWYNATGAAPKAADLHSILPPNSPVGTVITSSNIKSDAAYAGGAIGFALVGGQTHYSEQSWNPMCTGCTPPAPWIAAVTYASKKTPNAFYLAFEDGNFGTKPTDFNNDGDFNDDVFFLTGLTCLGGAEPCDTGKPGICAQGLTQCSASGLTCQQVNPAAPKETCNGLDDDCNAQSDEGDICQSGYVCDKGTCVQKCGTSEFACAPGLACSADGFCVDAACASVTCATGQVCVGGVCKAPCDGITCPFSQVCRVGKCVDPCAGVTCDTNQVCNQGVCIAGCSCAPCATGNTCDQGSGSCVQASCAGVTCDAGTHCESGACVDNCAGAACPTDQICQAGACVADPNASGSGMNSTGAIIEDVGSGTPSGSGMSSGKGGAGAGSSVGGAGSSVGGADGGPGSSGGCSCRLGDEDRTPSGLLGAGLLGLILASRRRKQAQG